MNARVFLLVLFSLTFMGVWDADQRSADIALARKHSRQLASRPCQVLRVAAVPAEAIAEADSLATLPMDLQTAFLLATSVPWLVPAEAIVPLPTESVNSAVELKENVPTSLSVAPASLDAHPALVPEPAVSNPAADTSSAGAAVLSAVALSINAAQQVIPVPGNLAAGTWQVMTESGQFFRIEVIPALINGETTNPADETLEESFCVTTTADGIRWCFVRFRLKHTTPAPSERVATESFESSP